MCHALRILYTIFRVIFTAALKGRYHHNPQLPKTKARLEGVTNAQGHSWAGVDKLHQRLAIAFTFTGGRRCPRLSPPF